MARLRTVSPPRQGVILLVVVVLLTLFLVVGLSFVLYAESEASASRISRESQTTANDRADIDPKELLNFGLGQLIYDVPDHGEHVYSAMRGHSLARTMYGWNYRHATYNAGTGNWDQIYLEDKPQFDPTFYTANPTANQVAYNGAGPLRGPALAPNYQDEQFVNYTPFVRYQNGFPTLPDGFVRDPERVLRLNGVDVYRRDVTKRADLTTVTSGTPGPNFAAGANVPYTFPDRTSMFLAAVQAAPPIPGAPNQYGGAPRVLRPSFFRPFNYRNGATTVQMNDFLTDPNFWTLNDPTLKYLTLRPRPADMGTGFPLPKIGGDVNNLGAAGFTNNPAVPEINDSFWMDLNFPVRTTATGKKYKPLFAFLVTDLDGRVNLNVHGNTRSGSTNNRTHASHQGVGRHEVNLSKVLDYKTAAAAAPTEWRNLLHGVAGIPGRYGTDLVPATAGVQYPNRRTRSYTSAIDYDGVDHTQSATNPLTNRLTFPNNFRTVPNFESNAGFDELYGNGSTPNPGLNQPLLYSALSPAGDDTQAAKLAENLYYLVGTAAGANASRASIYSLIPQNLDSPQSAGLNPISGVSRRFMTTTMSYDLDVPGMSPLFALSAGGPGVYQLPTAATPPARYPTGAAVTFPTDPTVWLNPSASAGDFSPRDGRSALLSRLDLNRKLQSYFDFNSGSPVYSPTLEPRAEQDRFQFCKDILQRLVLATGAITNPPPANPSPEFDALRYLAQLAVNIVDYIDEDDISFTFDWKQAILGTPGTTDNDFVYGTEAPRVLLNEIYAEMRNDPGDDPPPITGANQPLKVDFTIELFNPLQSITTPAVDATRHDARLREAVGPPTGTKQDAYKIEIYEQTGTVVTDIRKPDNTTGSVSGPPLVARCEQFPDDGTKDVIKPSDGTSPNAPPMGNVGFYVASVPGPTVRGTDPQATHTTNMLQGTTPIEASVPNKTYVVLLRRLANPHKAPGLGNPFVTVDYFTGVRAQDAIKYFQGSMTQRPEATQPHPSFGRRGPYIALNPGQEQDSGGSPGWTMFQHNYSIAQQSPPPPNRLDWLVFANRPLINPTELLHVSGFKPHELTQEFEATIPPAATPTKFAHRAPWRVADARIYRALEFFTVGERALAQQQGGLPWTEPTSTVGRKAGLININTIWDKHVLDALADANTTNFFTQNEVSGNTDTPNPASAQGAWREILQRRSAQLGGLATGIDVPFQSLAAPQAASNDRQYPLPPPPTTPPGHPGYGTVRAGILGDDTDLTGSGTPSVRTFPAMTTPTNHPHAWEELLSKVAGNLTTRSNVFAVYLTVGFFEVAPGGDTFRPVKLGAEIRTREGTVLRHKMFAIVDRTMLALDDEPREPGTLSSLDPGVSGTRDASNRLVRTEVFRQPNPERPPTASATDDRRGKRQLFLTTDTHIPPGSSSATVTVTIAGGIPKDYDQSSPTDPSVLQSLDNKTVYVGYGNQREMAVATIPTPAVPGALMLSFGPAGPRFDHPPGTTITTFRTGNPGPQDQFDVNKARYKYVVPHWRVIQ